MSNLLEMKEKELQAAVKDQKLGVKLKGNPGMRQAIWDAAADLQLAFRVPRSSRRMGCGETWPKQRTSRDIQLCR